MKSKVHNPHTLLAQTEPKESPSRINTEMQKVQPNFLGKSNWPTAWSSVIIRLAQIKLMLFLCHVTCHSHFHQGISKPKWVWFELPLLESNKLPQIVPQKSLLRRLRNDDPHDITMLRGLGVWRLNILSSYTYGRRCFALANMCMDFMKMCTRHSCCILEGWLKFVFFVVSHWLYRR